MLKLKKVDALDPKKACMEKALIGTNDSISGYFPEIYNHSKCFNKYPNSLKTADVTPKKKRKLLRTTIGLKVYFQFQSV